MMGSKEALSGGGTIRRKEETMSRNQDAVVNVCTLPAHRQESDTADAPDNPER